MDRGYIRKRVYSVSRFYIYIIYQIRKHTKIRFAVRVHIYIASISNINIPANRVYKHEKKLCKI